MANEPTKPEPTEPAPATTNPLPATTNPLPATPPAPAPEPMKAIQTIPEPGSVPPAFIPTPPPGVAIPTAVSSPAPGYMPPAPPAQSGAIPAPPGPAPAPVYQAPAPVPYSGAVTPQPVPAPPVAAMPQGQAIPQNALPVNPSSLQYQAEAKMAQLAAQTAEACCVKCDFYRFADGAVVCCGMPTKAKRNPLDPACAIFRHRRG